jgi:predicted RNA binding protein YcfA (HicA-like mRNA interferase family)
MRWRKLPAGIARRRLRREHETLPRIFGTQVGDNKIGMGGWMPTLKVRAMIAEVEAAGWVYVGTVGSNAQYKHPERSGKVTIPGKPGDDLTPKTVNSIRRQMRGTPRPGQRS